MNAQARLFDVEINDDAHKMVADDLNACEYKCTINAWNPDEIDITSTIGHDDDIQSIHYDRLKQEFSKAINDFGVTPPLHTLLTGKCSPR